LGGGKQMDIRAILVRLAGGAAIAAFIILLGA
jgi:hypothetical protein